MKAWRLILAIGGIVLVLYGAGKILLSVPPAYLVLLGAWLVGLLLIQHGLVSPLVVTVSWALRRGGARPRPPLPPGGVDPGGDGGRDP